MRLGKILMPMGGMTPTEVVLLSLQEKLFSWGVMIVHICLVTNDVTWFYTSTFGSAESMSIYTLALTWKRGLITVRIGIQETAFAIMRTPVTIPLALASIWSYSPFTNLFNFFTSVWCDFNRKIRFTFTNVWWVTINVRRWWKTNTKQRIARFSYVAFNGYHWIAISQWKWKLQSYLWWGQRSMSTIR